MFDAGRRTTGIALVLLCACVPAQGLAQGYPAKPVRMVVPFPPGAGLDVVARLIAQRLTDAWNSPVVVDNRAGAGGTVGADIVAKSTADGYTLLVAGVGSLGTSKGLYPRLPYDPVKDFAPIMLISRAPSVVLVHAGLPVRSIRELVAYAKSKPGALNYSSGGNGSVAHLSVEMFKHMAGVDLVHIPHKGPTPALAALAAGEAQVGVQSMLSALPLIQSGRIRVIAATGTKRLPELPEIPTVAEAGVPGYEFYVWYGVLAPAGTPAAVVQRLNRDLAVVFRRPEVENMLVTQGNEMLISSPAEFGRFLEREVAMWTRVIKAVGARLD
jgi:tripartite-type tricarboxylate transporter receptor subunit TctC